MFTSTTLGAAAVASLGLFLPTVLGIPTAQAPPPNPASPELLQLLSKVIPAPADNFYDLAWDTPACYYDDATPATAWELTVPSDRELENGGCGEGLLDNLRGACGVISGWGCSYGGAIGHNTAGVNFWTTNFCSAENVAGAIKAATNGGVNLVCNNVNEGGPSLKDAIPDPPPI